MKKLILLLLMPLLIACNGSVGRRGSESDGVNPMTEVLGDSISRAISLWKEVSLWHVSERIDSLTYDQDSLVCDYVVHGASVEVEEDLQVVLRFLLLDPRMYMSGDIIPSAPFIPEYLIMFGNKRETMLLVLSLSGGFMKIYYDGQHVRTLKYTREYSMLHFLNQVSPEESLEELMNFQKPE